MLQSLHINRARSVAEVTKSKEYVDDYKKRIEYSGVESEKLESTILEDEKQVKQYENDLEAITDEINSVNEKYKNIKVKYKKTEILEKAVLEKLMI